MTTIEKLNSVKELPLTKEQIAQVFELFRLIERRSYDAGFKDGLETFAHMKDGVTYVGTTGTLLKVAIAKRTKLHNYDSLVPWSRDD